MKERLRQLVKRHRFLLAIARTILLCSQGFCYAIYRAIRPLVIRQYFKSHQVRKLQIGAGPNILPGWLNTDKSTSSRRVLLLDAAKPFPFSDATIDYVYSEHVIEHLTYKQGQSMLRECFRVLKPSGRIRIATPDLETLIGLYTPQKSSLQERYIHWIIDTFIPDMDTYQESVVINNAFRNFGHQFLYDDAMLQSALEKAGFVAVTKWNVGDSDDEVFRGIECRGDGEMNRFETMVVEARRSL